MLSKIFVAFSSAVVKIRASKIKRLIKSRTDDDKLTNLSQSDFGRVLKETMLNLGPTFIKGLLYCLNMFLHLLFDLHSFWSEYTELLKLDLDLEFGKLM